MPTYVVLYNFTDQGAKNVRDTVVHAREHREANEKLGFKIHGLYWTQGRYDLVAIVEAPNERAMMVGLMNVAGAGNVRSETLRAFSEQEMEEFVNEITFPLSEGRLRPI